MNTFMPYANFKRCAEVLDRQRLGKQRIECLQMLRALTYKSYGWQNHPAVTMWRGHRSALAAYGEAMCLEWIGRGYRDTTLPKIQRFKPSTESLPEWINRRKVHEAYRSALIRKNFQHYSKFWKNKPAQQTYWPTLRRPI